MQHSSSKRITGTAIKKAAHGRWVEILSKLGGVSADILDGQHHPCPRCGGTDRFRWDHEKEFAYCDQCYNKSCGDGIDALAWLRPEWGLMQTFEKLGDYLNLVPVAASEPTSIPAPGSTQATSDDSIVKKAHEYNINEVEPVIQAENTMDMKENLSVLLKQKRSLLKRLAYPPAH